MSLKEIGVEIEPKLTTIDPRTCLHPRWATACTVNTVRDGAKEDKVPGPILGYTLDIQVRCSDCYQPGLFKGVAPELTDPKKALLPDHPIATLDGSKIRLPLTLFDQNKLTIGMFIRE